jgi:protein-S-isoprenylcysteine O-methyltransferase Ste14
LPAPRCGARAAAAHHVEEVELTAVLGDRYRSYEDRTKRLIPGVW